MTDSARVERVRSVFAAFNEGTFDARMIDELFDPQVEVLDFPEVPDRRSYRGHDGVKDFMADLAENWEETKVSIEEIRELGDAVVVLGHQRSVGALAGVPVDNSIGEVLEFEGDRIRRIRMFRDHAAALEAADA
jgi:ketosteroid isomerase-like protein